LALFQGAGVATTSLGRAPMPRRRCETWAFRHTEPSSALGFTRCSVCRGLQPRWSPPRPRLGTSRDSCKQSTRAYFHRRIGDLAPGKGEVFQSPREGENSLNHRTRVERGISSDISRDCLKHRQVRETTRLLGEPFSEPLFRRCLRKRATRTGCFQPALYLLQHIKVILDVFQRTVVRQLLEQRFKLLLSGH
jgi:hypothetical protein